LTARDIAVRFQAEGAEHGVRMGAELRRQIYLIFKETINNVVRHSDCTAADIELKIDGRELVLRVSDNGSGFDQLRVTEGNGLASIRRRAEQQGGALSVASDIGRGTTVTLRAPLSRRKLNSGARPLSQSYFRFESRGLKAEKQDSGLAGQRSG